jgi:uncharacterized membrane protein (DUF2068 family)
VRRSSIRAFSSVRAIALFEAGKGLLVLVAGFGLLSLIHHDLQRVAERLVTHLHLNAAHHYPRIFIDAAGRTSDTRLLLLALAAFGYCLVRLIEAYGLWKEARWAEWFAVVSAGIYLPFEAYKLFHGESRVAALALVANIFIIAVMIHTLRRPSPAPEPKAAP